MPTPFYGWIVVVVCIACKVGKCQGQNTIMAFTVPHLLKDLGLSRSELGIVFSLATVSAGFVQPSVGLLMNRFGGKICIAGTQLFLCATLLVFSAVKPGRSRLMLYVEVALVFFFLRALCLGAAEIFPNACVQHWFHRRLGRAMSIMILSQQLGTGSAAFPVSRLVTNGGWRLAMQLGACVNFVLFILSLFLLRNRPEDVGLLADGDAVLAAVTVERTAHVEQIDHRQLPKGLWQLFVFSFVFAIIFGGTDFYMVEIIAEAAGPRTRDIHVSNHILFPMGLTQAVCTPLIGELMDKPSKNKQCIPAALLFFCGVATCLATCLIRLISSPALAVIFAILKGTTQSVFTGLLTSGLAFSAMGVGKDCMGYALGKNQFATLLGTGCGPLILGAARDIRRSYMGALIVTSLPPLFLGASVLRIAVKSVRSDRCHASPQEASCAGEIELQAQKC